MLLPGTFCDWYGNFSNVIDLLKEDFYLLIVSYSGFEKNDGLQFNSIMDEIEKIEDYIIENHAGHVDTIYGSSLGGSLVAYLVYRQRITCKNAILGSSDLDQSSKISAEIKTKLVLKVAYPIIVSGKIENKLTQFFLRKKPQTFIDKLIEVLGGRREWINKQSCINQFKSDLKTSLPLAIDSKNTKIHIFYATKMGVKYLARYKKHFANPIIHEQNYAHEELLFFHPEKWVTAVKEIINEGMLSDY